MSATNQDGTLGFQGGMIPTKRSSLRCFIGPCDGGLRTAAVVVVGLGGVAAKENAARRMIERRREGSGCIILRSGFMMLVFVRVGCLMVESGEG